MALIGTMLLWLLWIVLGLIGLVLAVLIIALLIPVQVWLRYDAAGFAVRLKILFFKMQILPAEEKTPHKKRAGKSGAKTSVSQKEKARKKQGKTICAESTKAHTAAERPITESPDRKLSDPTVPSAAQPAPDAQSAKPSAKSPQVQKAQTKPAKQMDPLVRRILENLPAVLHMAGRFVGAVLRSLHFDHLEVVVPVSGGEPDEVARRVGKANAWFYAIVSPLENVLHLRWRRVHVFPDYKEECKKQLLLAGCVRGQLLPVAIAALHLLVSLKKEKIL